MSGGEDWLGEAHRTLRAAGLRTGGGREQVMQQLADHGCLLSAHEIAVRLRDADRPVSLATVYRALDTLHQLGLLARLETSDGLTRFEPVDARAVRHHHSVCRGCGRVVAFSDPALEAVIAAIAERLPFVIEHHEVVLRGACAECRAEVGAAR